MQKRRIGSLEVSAIGLGCMSLSTAYGSPPPKGTAEEVLLGALDAGYTYFDTAVAYGMGHNETLVGEVLGPHRDRIVLASKCGLTNATGTERVMDGTPETIKALCDLSLKRLRTDVIDLYYLHRMDRNVPIEDSVGALADLAQAGKIRAIGLSEVSAETLRRAHAVHPIAALQSEYSPWTRNPELGALEACRDLGVAFVAFSPVARGFLAGGGHDPEKLETTDMRVAMPRFQGEALASNLRLYDAFAGIAVEAGCTPAQLCLAWLLAKGDDIIPIPGTGNPAHMREDAAAAGVALSPATIAKVDATVNGDTVRGSRYSPQLQASVDTEKMPGE
jgi:aryl-alcohol dehydrogenase-like predicted oxidoreductase